MRNERDRYKDRRNRVRNERDRLLDEETPKHTQQHFLFNLFAIHQGFD